jgi:hypothetical protein
MLIVVIVLTILIGALANRSATYLASEIGNGHSARLAVQFTQPARREFLKIYVMLALPLAFLNGFLLRLHWLDSLIVGIGTWLGALALISITGRFNPARQFYVFAGLNLVLVGANLTAAVSSLRRFS